jgi:glucosamine--fructose-6-phosphate aminotransferase (isomerizing)
MQLGDLSLVAEAAHEQSVAQTRSFSSMLLLVKALAATVAEVSLDDLDLLPGLLRKLFAETADLSGALGRRLDLDRIFFLGSGFLYGIANEAMLKMKEMSLSNSEGFHFLEFRHGPISMANEAALVIGLVGDAGRMHEEKVMTEVRALGAETLALNSLSDECCANRVSFDAAMPAWTLPALYLPPLQLLSYYRSVAKGLDPDNPRNLTAVVSLDPAAFEGS